MNLDLVERPLGRLDDEPADRDAWSAAARRVTFDLSCRRSPARREFRYLTLTGPDIDDAHHHGGPSIGTWTNDDAPGPVPWSDSYATVKDWTLRYLEMALQEAVHECLEWLRVDDRRWIDPHCPLNEDVTDCVSTLFDALLDLQGDLDNPSTQNAPAGDDELPWEQAAARVDYQLSIRRSPEPRCFTRGLLTGPDVDNAYRPAPNTASVVTGLQQDPLRQVSGIWEDDTPAIPHDDDDLRATTADWINKYLRMAIQEVVHECLEWLTVDGVRWIDPHGPLRAEVLRLVDTLAADLHRARNGHPDRAS